LEIFAPEIKEYDLRKIKDIKRMYKDRDAAVVGLKNYKLVY
jgi:hypothetical protein